MSFLSQMYSKRETPNNNLEKNPNRVSGGLRARGVDHVTMVSEDGREQSLATSRYVQSLETRIKAQHQSLINIERKVQRLVSDQPSTSRNNK